MPYQKAFDSWNDVKKKIDQKKLQSDQYFNEREIWWGSLGINIGFEQDGKNEQFERPLLVIKKFNREIVWVLPITSVAKENQYHHKLQGDTSFVILSQIRLLSTRRLRRLVKTISGNEFRKIIAQVKHFFP